jgi:REP-associated tyrosine transposase
MARLPRFVIPGQPQHVIQRGNNRDNIFLAEEDYRFYLAKLAQACRKFQCAIHAYVLMTNHVHLLITPATENGISKVMQSLGRNYVQYFNYRYQRTGTLWEGRYKATLLDSERYLLACSLYIELNPVRASMVRIPDEYLWSSYHGNALGKDDLLLKKHLVFQALGQNPLERCKNYKALFEHHLSDKIVDEIREATNKSWVLGNDKFKDQIEELSKRQCSPKAKGGDRRSKAYREMLINRV